MSGTDQANAVEGVEEEPSMEEILSSIRRIISDDDEDAAATDDAPEADMEVPAETLPEPEPIPEPPVDPAPAPEEDVLELTDVFNEEDTSAEKAPEPEPVADTMDVSEDEIDFASDPEPAPEPIPEPIPAPEPAPLAEAPKEQTDLLSADAELASSAAFNKLAATILSNSQQTRTVEDLIQEMLKPMLKEWLDQNLPDTVERLVREEIERVARRR